MNRWFVLRDGAWTGPFDPARLQEMARGGQFGPDDYVARQGSSSAGRAREDADLLPVLGNSGGGRGGDASSGLATPLRRIAAVSIDSALQFAVLTPFLVLAIATAVEGVSPGGQLTLATGFLSVGASLIMLVGSTALLIVQCSMLTTRGQTIGKRMLLIKVVMKDTGELPGFWRIVGIRLFLNSLLALNPIYVLADALFVFSPRHQCLHDRAARTKVINLSQK